MKEAAEPDLLDAISTDPVAGPYMDRAIDAQALPETLADGEALEALARMVFQPSPELARNWFPAGEL